MATHTHQCTCDCYHCMLRRATRRAHATSPTASPTPIEHRPQAEVPFRERLQTVQLGRVGPKRGVPGDNARYNNWEKGKAYERRPGGTVMPYLDQHGEMIPIKPFTEGDYDKALRIREQRRALAATNQEA